jgi:hypothetical protein
MTAMPIDPPTCRMLLITADPTPALSTGTEPMADAVVGAIVHAIPRPPTIRPGRSDQNVASASRRPNRARDSATSVMPAPMSHLPPKRSASRPATGATMMISSVIGRNVAPVWTAVKPRMFWMNSELKKNTPNIASPTSSIVAFAPANVLLRNNDRSSIGRR